MISAWFSGDAFVMKNIFHTTLAAIFICMLALSPKGELFAQNNANVAQMEQKANGGDAVSQYRLALAYSKGEGVTRDNKEAARWFRQAAEQGHAESQRILGNLYFAGRGVEKDDKAAFRWTNLAARQGNADAQVRLEYYYGYGHGVAKNRETAIMWLMIGKTNSSEQVREGLRLFDLLKSDNNGFVTPQEFRNAEKRARVCIATHYQDCD